VANEVNVAGFKDLQKFLNTLAPKIERNILRAALSKGARVVRDEAKTLVPVALPNEENRKLYGGHAGALRNSLRVGSRARGGKVTAYIRAGGKKKGADTYYAHWVEYGTRTHFINSKSGYLRINGRWVKAPVTHPGAKAKPFLRPALDSRASDALRAVGNFIKHRLDTKHGLDTKAVDINVEGEFE